MADGKPLKVPCPHCRRPALFSPANPWRPFCSERCRQRDLGAWANEEYRLAEATPQDGDAEDDGAAPRH